MTRDHKYRPATEGLESFDRRDVPSSLVPAQGAATGSVLGGAAPHVAGPARIAGSLDLTYTPPPPGVHAASVDYTVKRGDYWTLKVYKPQVVVEGCNRVIVSRAEITLNIRVAAVQLDVQIRKDVDGGPDHTANHSKKTGNLTRSFAVTVNTPYKSGSYHTRADYIIWVNSVPEPDDSGHEDSAHVRV